MEPPLILQGASAGSIISGTNTGSGDGVAVYGYHEDSGNFGVLGESRAGVYGKALGSNVAGVSGEVTGSHAAGVYGKATGSDTVGVRGEHAGGNFGYLGDSGCGVYGFSSADHAGYFAGKVAITTMPTFGGPCPVAKEVQQ